MTEKSKGQLAEVESQITSQAVDLEAEGLLSDFLSQPANSSLFEGTSDFIKNAALSLEETRIAFEALGRAARAGRGTSKVLPPETEEETLDITHELSQ